ncbi:MAG: MBOAT family O-acyltransferase [Bacteroidota bacterium]
MLFNSIDFIVFLPIVFVLYWMVKSNLKVQNFLVLTASYIFYGWWDWRFLSLIFFSTIVDYFVGLSLNRQDNLRKRRLLLLTSIVVNIGFLGFFKYYNFFLENFATAFTFFGGTIDAERLEIILPVGISFYTFQTMSYTIDVYRKKLEPTKDFIAFASFVSFFPQLVAGPIVRAKQLLPQFYIQRTFVYTKAADGLRQILWGIFKKVVIADNCAEYVNYIFDRPEKFDGSTLLLGGVLFAFQIYGDFSGYSDIAIGTSRLFGIDLPKNFAFPYFSRDIAEFWRRWHISLSTWFRDYVYIPLGGSRVRIGKQIRNVFIIFLVSGFWHGANWTFIIWGALNALFFLPLLLFKQNRNYLEVVAIDRRLPNFKELAMMGLTFFITVLAWIFFRAENLHHALEYLSGIFNSSLFSIPELPDFGGKKRAHPILYLLFGFILIEWIGRKDNHALENIGLGWNRLLRWSMYAFIIFIIGMYMQTHEMPFIYFQF